MNPAVAMIVIQALGMVACPALPDLKEMAAKTDNKVDDSLVQILAFVCVLTGQGEALKLFVE